MITGENIINLDKEEWKEINGYDGNYLVSTLGRVKSVDRYIQRKDGVIQHRKGKLIEPLPNPDGYLQFKLSKNGKYKTVKLHRIVAETFIDNPANLPEINHKDCNRANNCVENLEWITHYDNVQHSTKLGHYHKPRGENNCNYKGTKLKDFYASHPEERIKLGRPGSQNGRARQISLVIGNESLHFGYIGECVDYLLSNNIISGVKPDSLHTRITERLRTGKSYRGLTFLEI